MTGALAVGTHLASGDKAPPVEDKGVRYYEYHGNGSWEKLGSSLMANANVPEIEAWVAENGFTTKLFAPGLGHGAWYSSQRDRYIVMLNMDNMGSERRFVACDGLPTYIRLLKEIAILTDQN